MSVVLGTLFTMGLQIAASVINTRTNRKNTAEIKQMQKEMKERNQARTLQREQEKFIRSCKFQLQMEEYSHQEKIKRLNQDFLNVIESLAHSRALKNHYPLKISPYIIGRSIIPTCDTQINHSRQEIFCILTGSNHSVFNRDVLPMIDDMLCDAISTYWNQRSMHTVCYYSNIWNEDVIFCDENITNLQSILKTPTLTITPFFANHDGKYQLTLKLYLWGLGDDNSISTKIPLDIAFEALPSSYTKDTIDDIINTFCSYALCAMAQNIDTYYWTNYYQAPIFPSILSKGMLRTNPDIYVECTQSYIQLYKTLVLGLYSEGTASLCLNTQNELKEVAEINQFNFPQRSITFLHSLTELTINNPEESKNLITATFLSIYEARTGLAIQSLSDVDVNLLMKDDIDLLVKLIDLSKACKVYIKDMVDILKEYIKI